MTPFTSLIQWGHFRPANLEISKSYLKKLFYNFKFLNRTKLRYQRLYCQYVKDASRGNSKSRDESEDYIFQLYLTD